MNTLVIALVTFVAAFIAHADPGRPVPLAGLYTIVEERRCHVYVLFGKVVATIDEPGLHFLVTQDGPRSA